MGRLVETLGVIGGSAGVLYATGYLVLAGHSRVLGLPLRSTDTATLLLNAWEFVVQGALYSVLRSLQFLSAYLTPIALSGSVAVVVVGLAWRHRRDRLKPWIRTASRAWDRQRIPLALVGLLVLIAVQTWHLAAHIVPAASVSSLLSAPAPVYAPFPALRPSLRAFFEAHWDDLRLAIVGDGQQSNARVLSRLYVMHVLVTASTCGGAALIWLTTRRRRFETLLRPFAIAAVVLGLFLCLYTPLYYGITMKSYRYPRVRLTSAETKAGDPTKQDFLNTALNPEFLLQITDSDYVLYNARFREIHLVRRDLVGIVKIMSDDFLFPNEPQ